MLKIINIYKVAFIPVVAQKDIRNRKCQNNNAFTPTEMNYFHICKTAKKEICRVFIMNIRLLFYSPLDYYSNSQSSQKRRQRKAYPKPKAVRRSQSILFLILKNLKFKNLFKN